MEKRVYLTLAEEWMVLIMGKEYKIGHVSV